MRKTITVNGMRALDARIKSIQRGTITITGSASGTATITTVNTRHAVIRFTGYTNGTYDRRDMIPRIDLYSATAVIAYRYSTVADGTLASYEVTEYWPGVIKSIQRGTFNGGGAVNVTITAVNLAYAELENLGWRYNDAANSPVSYDWNYQYLTTATNLYSSNAAGGAFDTGYQVVEFWQ